MKTLKKILIPVFFTGVFGLYFTSCHPEVITPVNEDDFSTFDDSTGYNTNPYDSTGVNDNNNPCDSMYTNPNDDSTYFNPIIDSMYIGPYIDPFVDSVYGDSTYIDTLFGG